MSKVKNVESQQVIVTSNKTKKILIHRARTIFQKSLSLISSQADPTPAL